MHAHPAHRAHFFGFLGLCLGSALPGLAWADAQGVVVSPIISTSETANGQPIAFPEGQAQVVVSRYEIPPSAQLPVHMHPFPRMAYVISGTLVVTDVAANTEAAFGEGSFLIEMVGTWHYGRNGGTEPVQLLVIDLVPEGQANTITQGQ